jgi:hypothetical protein
MEPDGHVVTGLSWKNLERKVVEYRRRVGGNVDTVAQDILEQVCRNSPGFCLDDRQKARIEVQVRENLKARSLKWLGEMAGHRRGGPLSHVDHNTAIDRSRRCLACPKRMNNDLGCASCQKNVDKLRLYCLDNHPSVAPGLGSCDITGEDLAVSIHLKQNPLPPEGLLDYCWRRNP